MKPSKRLNFIVAIAALLAAIATSIFPTYAQTLTPYSPNPDPTEPVCSPKCEVLFDKATASNVFVLVEIRKYPLIPHSFEQNLQFQKEMQGKITHLVDQLDLKEVQLVKDFNALTPYVILKSSAVGMKKLAAMKEIASIMEIPNNRDVSLISNPVFCAPNCGMALAFIRQYGGNWEFIIEAKLMTMFGNDISSTAPQVQKELETIRPLLIEELRYIGVTIPTRQLQRTIPLYTIQLNEEQFVRLVFSPYLRFIEPGRIITSG